MEVGERLVEMGATARSQTAGATMKIGADVARKLDQHPQRVEALSPPCLEVEAKLIHLDIRRIAPNRPVAFVSTQHLASRRVGKCVDQIGQRLAELVGKVLQARRIGVCELEDDLLIGLEFDNIVVVGRADAEQLINDGVDQLFILGMTAALSLSRTSSVAMTRGMVANCSSSTDCNEPIDRFPRPWQG